MSIVIKHGFIVCAAVIGLCGCDDTTGVQLAIHGSVVADQVSITATGPLGTVTHVEPAPGGSDWTLQLVATFRPDIGDVTFTATPLRNQLAVGECPARSVMVTPHHVVDAALDCAASPNGDGGIASGDYFGVVLADSPVAYYHLGEATGTTAVDSAGGLDGAYGASVTRHQPSPLADSAATADGAAGFPGGAAVAGNSVRAAGVALAPKTALSVELWLQSAGGNEGATVLQYDYGGGKVVPVYSFMLTDNHVVFYVHAGGKTTAATITSAATIATGQAYHIVGTYDESASPAMNLWIDGALDTMLAGNSGDVVHGDATTSGLGIGGAFNDGSGALGWNGVIDEVAVYAMALPLSRVQAHYQAGTTK